MRDFDPCPCWKHDLAAVLAGLTFAALIVLLDWWV